MSCANPDFDPEDPMEESALLGEAVAVDPELAEAMEALCGPLEEMEEHRE